MGALSAFSSDALILTLIGILLGAVITWLVSWAYYKRAGDELRREAFLLHIASSAIIYRLENPEAKLKIIRDDEGRLTGQMVVYSEGRLSGSPSVEGVNSHEE